eukprot:CAMPEP_0196733330 /NCGR_PEP_ID=MMETSP1091-20130531/12436_1 /TAXON_ID=302021 /ORGANISM="Rhodomonas sp., Strain CCMP768" /LENGTH=317 /DNA_ID=CAMNT_0042076695 /DNA_START=44 /DNA_END=997 /DNA_ORIENTATION=+
MVVRATLLMTLHFVVVSGLADEALLNFPTRRGSQFIGGILSAPHAMHLRGGKESKSPVIFQLNEDPNAKTVEVCGSWDGWQARLPLSKNGDGWKQAHFLPRGVHQYKFILDGTTWKCSNNLPQAPGPEGFMNNVVEVSNPKRGLKVSKEDLKSALNKDVRTARLHNLQARMERLQNRVDSFSEADSDRSRGSSMSRTGAEEAVAASKKVTDERKAAASESSDVEDGAEQDDSAVQHRVHEIAKMGRGPSTDDHKWTPIDRHGKRLGTNKGGWKKLGQRVLVAALLAVAGAVAKLKFDEQQQALAAAAASSSKNKKRW